MLSYKKRKICSYFTSEISRNVKTSHSFARRGVGGGGGILGDYLKQSTLKMKRWYVASCLKSSLGSRVTKNPFQFQLLSLL